MPLTHRSILIIGGTGSLGKKLLERYLNADDVRIVHVYSRDESKQWSLKNDLANHPRAGRLQFWVGDIRDVDRLVEVMQIAHPNHVIVAAALKQVDTCEASPLESVKTNLLGTQNVISAVNRLLPANRPVKVLFISTDKAASPVNTYGMCKAISERLITSQNNPDVTYLCTRYGNVLESRGSIIPLFRYQAENALFLTVTDPEMTRFAMNLEESVDLIEMALERGRNGETWIPRLRSMRIGDLAEIFAEHYHKELKIVGHRPGEKLHEDLINASESVRVRYQDDRYYAIASALKTPTGPSFTYTSASEVLTKVQLQDYLESLGIFTRDMSSFVGQSIEEIRTKGK